MPASTPVQPDWDCPALAALAGQAGDSRSGAFWCEEVKVPQADGAVRRVNTLFVRDVTQAALDAAVAAYVPAKPKKSKPPEKLRTEIAALATKDRDRLLVRVLVDALRRNPGLAREEGIALDGEE